MEEIKFTVAIRGKERIAAMERLIDKDHSSRIAVLNKGLDLLIEHDAKVNALLAGKEVQHA